MDSSWVFILSVIVSVVLGIFELLNTSKNENSCCNTESIFDQYMDSLAAGFPAQNWETWHELKVKLGSNLQQHPSPNSAVITALLPPSMEVGFANCLLKMVAFSANQAIVAVSGNDGNIPILPILLTNSTLEKQNIRRKFEKLGNFAGNPIILLNEDLIKTRTDLEILKDLWTNKTAMGGSVPTVIFIVRALDEDADRWHHSRRWEISHKVLTHSWEHINYNMKYDLISHLTKSVVLLNQGDLCTDNLMFSDYITNIQPSFKLTEVYNKINQQVTDPLIKSQALLKRRLNVVEKRLESIQEAYTELGKKFKEFTAKHSEKIKTMSNNSFWDYWPSWVINIIIFLYFVFVTIRVGHLEHQLEVYKNLASKNSRNRTEDESEYELWTSYAHRMAL